VQINRIKLFIFDMDGVLTETSEQHFLAWKELASHIGITITREFNEQLKGISRLESLDRILEYGGVAKRYSPEEKLELAKLKNDNYVKMISRFTEENLFDGVIKLFSDLKNRDIKIAIGSASKNAPMLVALMGIKKYINYIVNPEDIEKGKPAPDTFLKAASALSIPPSACIGVEDAVAGITAIKAAGMFAVGIGEKDILKDADIVYRYTRDIDLPQLL